MNCSFSECVASERSRLSRTLLCTRTENKSNWKRKQRQCGFLTYFPHTKVVERRASTVNLLSSSMCCTVYNVLCCTMWFYVLNL